MIQYVLTGGNVAASENRVEKGLVTSLEESSITDEDSHALFLFLVEMSLAVLQLRDAQRDGLGASARALHVQQFLKSLSLLFNGINLCLFNDFT